MLKRFEIFFVNYAYSNSFFVKLQWRSPSNFSKFSFTNSMTTSLLYWTRINCNIDVIMKKKRQKNFCGRREIRRPKADNRYPTLGTKDGDPKNQIKTQHFPVFPLISLFLNHLNARKEPCSNEYTTPVQEEFLLVAYGVFLCAQ